VTITRLSLLVCVDVFYMHTYIPAGWMDVRLLAPRAELRLQIAGGSSMIDSGRLSYLGEALRALLVMEVRPWGGGARQRVWGGGGRGGAGQGFTQLLS